MRVEERICPVRRVTSGPEWHFFGYFYQTPWDASGRYMVGLQVPPMERFPTPEDEAGIGLIDLENDDAWIPVATTRAWNWQKGAMLQWLDWDDARRILYNTRTGDGYGTVIHNLDSGEKRLLSRPVYAVAPDQRQALSVNYARLRGLHRAIGYAERPDLPRFDPAPADDGLFALDLVTGESRLIISLAQIVEIEPLASMKGAQHWFSLISYNPSSTRFVFMHRWSSTPEDQGAWHHRMYTASSDGAEITLLDSTDELISHPAWHSDTEVHVWSYYQGRTGYYLYEDRGNRVTPFAHDLLTENGHSSYSPDGRWLLTDTYPDPIIVETEKYQGPPRSTSSVMLYNIEEARRIDVGRFYASPEIWGAIRCDLHPRWDREGRQVCIDSIHEGDRQMYVIDVSSVTG